MSDARFAILKTDPRFRRPKKHHSKVVLDDRFKDLLGEDQKKGKGKKKKGKPTTASTVDKYGRRVSETQEKDDLRRFYRLEAEDEDEELAAVPSVVDYARGAVVMESSDEEEDEEERGLPSHVPLAEESGSDSDEGGFVSLGTDLKKPEEDEDEIDLDENTIAALDAQVAEYAKVVPEHEEATDAKQSWRLAVVNLDWDYVRAVHLYKIFSSLVSPTAPLASVSTSRAEKASTSTSKGGANVARGKILSVRVYPSEFGKKRMAKEEKEGPPTELFRKKNKKAEEEINEKTIIETGTEADYDEAALRKYQLERLRYYYAIVECDTAEAAVHVYNELEGTELERSANVFDISFVPDNMTFDDEPRDEATQLSNAPYRAVEFVTDALRHSKVKLTWDEDDPERNHILRRSLTKKEIEEADFRAYIASSSSSEGGSEDEDGDKRASKKKLEERKTHEAKGSKRAERDRLRMLLLGGNDDELPEGWGDAFDHKANRGGKKSKIGEGENSDVDMEVTFTPGLSETKNPEDENTLERYQRKKKEKRKKKKEEVKKKQGADEDGDEDGDEGVSMKTAQLGFDDEFFGIESDSRDEREEEEEAPSNRSKKKSTEPKKPAGSSKAELALLATSDNPHSGPAHFDMKAVLKAEKQSKHKKSRHKAKKRGREDDVDDGPGETQDDFAIDVKDDRFTAIHDDHRFAIDPTNPQFKKTKGMAKLLNESSKRRKSNPHSDHEPAQSRNSSQQQSGRSLQSLVESVKQKSAAGGHNGLGKRRKLGLS